MRRQKDTENSVRELLKGFGLCLGRLLRSRWDDAVPKSFQAMRHSLQSSIPSSLPAKHCVTNWLSSMGRSEQSCVLMPYAEGS